MARAWTLVDRPVGMPTMANFALIELPDRALADGEVRVRNAWLSVDPYMRARMNEIKYAPAYEIGTPMYGSAVGEVIESRNTAFAVGDHIFHAEGWRDEAIVDPAGPAREGVPPFRLPDLGVPEQVWLHNMGIPGGTAWFALMRTGGAQAGETLFVSSAAGAVGSAVVQIAKAKGMTVIGSAGGAPKCDFVRQLGADATIDYKSENVTERLRSLAPDGIHLYFDNVGGPQLDAALACTRPFARIVLCGMIGVYNEDKPLQLSNARRIIQARLRLEGMYYGDYAADLPTFYEDMGKMIRAGQVVAHETVAEGLEAMPSAFLGLFDGVNQGKMLVRP